ncbi:histidinol-phosphatase [Intestinibaculum porci]|uniref:Histidinol-phosphatase n=1 Tax=Intestinibaculum porci TaxID=2487118 RepID=A0A3G9JH92_9FIRM|nr:histidinol-phosphatase [Intestinibaculum porci]BBH27705.1 histidinol-phosphatase [Intestinibaculum porci]
MKNYHTHTPRCHHAIGKEEDYILNAMKAGYTELGFSDHAPWHYASGYHPTMRMEESQIDDYVSILLALKEKYKDQISIKIGFEAEYFPEMLDGMKQVLKDYPIDYLILGHHYNESDEYGEYYGFPQKDLTTVKTYVHQVLRAMDTGLYSYVAHPDVIAYDQKDPRHLLEMEKICAKAKLLDMPLEFNLLGFKEGRDYPSIPFFALCKKHGNRIIIGTDAHEPTALSDVATYKQARFVLDQLGLEVTEDIHFLR